MGRFGERWWRWCLSAAMIVAGIGWVLYAPYDPETVWRAIPADAVFFSRHLQAAGRFPDLSRNPLMMTLLRSAGISPSALYALNDNPETEARIRELFGRDVVIAYIPDLGGSNEPAWVFASWIGNRAQRLRWTLSIRGISGVHAVELPGHETFWRLDNDPVETGKHLSLALVDGYLLGCISAFSTGVKIPMATWNRERNYPSLQTVGWREDAQALVDSGTPDWAAFKRHHRDRPAETPLAMLVALQQLNASYAQGRLIANVALPLTSADDVPSRSVSGGLRDILGESPVLFSFVSPAVLAFFMDQPYAPGWARTLAAGLVSLAEDASTETVASDTVDQPFFVSVLDRRYAGSLNPGNDHAWAAAGGVKVPAIVAGIHAGNPERADTVLMDILDELNREYRLGLIPRRDPMETVTVIEDSRSGASWYQRLSLQERVGVVYHQGWLLFAGQAMVLERLLESASRGDELQPAYAWMPPAEADTAPAYCWTDLTAFAPLATEALSALSLMFWIRDPQHTQPIRQNLAHIHAWIESIRVMEQGRIWFDRTDPKLHVQFELGIPATATR